MMKFFWGLVFGLLFGFLTLIKEEYYSGVVMGLAFGILWHLSYKEKKNG